MADYYPLIARAVGGLDNSTGEARRALYERARTALVAQLRSIEPPLSEADITRERLALEDAIRKVESESVRKARSERPAMQRSVAPRMPVSPAAPRMPVPPSAPASPAGEPRDQPLPGAAAALRPAAPASARNRILSARTSPVSREGIKNLRGVVDGVDDLGAASAKSAQSARATRASYGGAPRIADDDLPSLNDSLEPHVNDEAADLLDGDTAQPETAYFPDEQQPPPRMGEARPRMRAPEEHYEEPRPPRSYRGLAKFAVILIVLAGIAATVSWQWSNISALYHFVSNMRARPTQTAQAPTPQQPKFSGRVPQEQTTPPAQQTAPPGQQTAPPAGTSPQQNAPPVAQRVVLYEEDPNNPQGRQYIGSAIWRTETVSPGSGLAPELEVRADITIPEKNMTVTWTLRRNTDQALPASHTIEIMFNLPPNFAGGGIANVPGVLMKDSEQARGVPLSGLAVKVTNGFFLIGLSAVQADVERNVQLLKDRPWFDIPIVYNNGGRAILALEKGPPGDRAFADAFAAWAK